MDTRDFGSGEVFLSWKSDLTKARMFYANPKPVKAMRVHKFLAVEPPKPVAPEVTETLDRLVANLRNPDWKASAFAAETPPEELSALQYGFTLARKAGMDFVRCGAMAVASLSTLMAPEPAEPDFEDAEDEDFRRFLALDDDEEEEASFIAPNPVGESPGAGLLPADIDAIMKQAAQRLAGLDGEVAGSAE
jgi:intracellular multiplication protein IcmO